MTKRIRKTDTVEHIYAVPNRPRERSRQRNSDGVGEDMSLENFSRLQRRRSPSDEVPPVPSPHIHLRDGRLQQPEIRNMPSEYYPSSNPRRTSSPINPAFEDEEEEIPRTHRRHSHSSREGTQMRRSASLGYFNGDSMERERRNRLAFEYEREERLKKLANKLSYYQVQEIENL